MIDCLILQDTYPLEVCESLGDPMLGTIRQRSTGMERRMQCSL